MANKKEAANGRNWDEAPEIDSYEGTFISLVKNEQNKSEVRGVLDLTRYGREIISDVGTTKTLRVVEFETNELLLVAVHISLELKFKAIQDKLPNESMVAARIAYLGKEKNPKTGKEYNNYKLSFFTDLSDEERANAAQILSLENKLEAAPEGEEGTGK